MASMEARPAGGSVAEVRKARYTCRVEEQAPPASTKAEANATNAAVAAATGTDASSAAAASSEAPAADLAPAAAPVKVVVWEPAPVSSCLAMVISRLQHHSSRNTSRHA